MQNEQDGQKSELLPIERSKVLPSLEKRLEIAKIKMLLNQPFFGVVLLQMGLYPAKTVEHIYANTKIILYNPEYFEQLEPDEMKSALLHGVLHCVLNHIERGMNRNLDTWELATDYALSFLIEEQDLPLPPDHPYNEEYRNTSAEKIYEILMNEKKKQEKSKDGNKGNNRNKNNEEDENDDDGEKPFDNLPDFKDLMNNNDEDENGKKDDNDDKDDKQNPDNNSSSSQNDDNEKNDEQDNSQNKKDNQGDNEKNSENNNKENDKQGDSGGNSNNNSEGNDKSGGKGSGDGDNEENSKNQTKNSNNSSGNDNNNSDLNQNKNEDENGQGNEDMSQDNQKQKQNQNQKQKQQPFESPNMSAGKNPLEVESLNSEMNGLGSPDMDLTLKDLENFKGVIREAYTTTKSQGILPADLIRQIDEILNPKLDWRQILAKYILKNSRSGWKWVPPNYKYLPMSLVIPSNRVKALEVIVGVDTSGSISMDELIDFISEVQGIVATANEYKLTLISCDSRIHDVLEYDNFHPIDYKEAKKLSGGGGTDFRPVFDYIEKRRLKPDCLLYMTDGYGTFPSGFQPYPVLWMMTTEVVAPMGLTIKYVK